MQYKLDFEGVAATKSDIRLLEPKLMDEYIQTWYDDIN